MFKNNSDLPRKLAGEEKDNNHGEDNNGKDNNSKKKDSPENNDKPVRPPPLFFEKGGV
jgi:hypothetical protein